MVKKIDKEVKVTREMASKYTQMVERFMPEFEKLISKENEDDAFLAASAALRVAAKIATKYGGSKSGFIDSAENNFDLEKNKEANSQRMRMLN